MTFLLASNNNHKLTELQRILSPMGITVVTPKQLGISLEDVEENGATFAENAKIKALAAFKMTNMPVVADDSGLCVDALNGEPGVFTARYAGENASDEDKYNKLLNNMRNVEKQQRKAHFVTSICCILNEKDIIEVEGVCDGYITEKPVGDNGFGYDPVFLCELNKTFAQLNDTEKDKVSHRGRALRLLKSELEKRGDLNLC